MLLNINGLIVNPSSITWLRNGYVNQSKDWLLSVPKYDTINCVRLSDLPAATQTYLRENKPLDTWRPALRCRLNDGTLLTITNPDIIKELLCLMKQ